ncbi:MAG: hypothetical protein ACTSRG_13150 [Candidatus Helarchaeota archaeon]
MDIEINVQTGYTEKFTDLIPFQGNLKNFEYESRRRDLKESIKSMGIIYPTFIWKNENKKYIWDGHGRQEIYKELEKEGYGIPDLPVVYIIARNRADAKTKLLKKEQDYGRRIRKEGLTDFLKHEEINTSILGCLNFVQLGKINIDELNKMVNGIEETIVSKKNPKPDKDNEENNQVESSQNSNNQNKEIDTETFGNDLKNECPRCGFEYNE